MSTRAKSLWTVLLLLVVAVWAKAVVTQMSGQRGRDLVTQGVGPTGDEAVQRAEQLVAGWETEYTDRNLYTKTPTALT